MQSLMLGTAQWGLDYGATNRMGRLSDDTIAALLSAAHTLGIHALDTAAQYGDAEVRIADLAMGFTLQTKISASGRKRDAITSALQDSLGRLRADRIESCLIHDWPTLSEPERVEAAAALEQCRNDGTVNRVGISGYVANDLEAAEAAFAQVDIVQVPVSILDQRLDAHPALARLRSTGALVQARSVFLQGVALRPLGTVFEDHHDIARLHTADSDPLSLCIGYISSCDWIDTVVIAPTSVEELTETVEVHRTSSTDANWPQFASSDDRLLDPRQWPQQAPKS